MGVLVEKFKKLGPAIFVKKLLGFEPVFTCAVRIKKEKSLYEKAIDEPFLVMPQSRENWYADPLFYEYCGHTYLFMEELNYKTRRGTIVCSEIVDGKFSLIEKVIDAPFHVSFPNIFSFKNELYMIPEAEASGGIVLYKCEEFPNKWKLIAQLKTEVPIVDSVISSIDGNMITFVGSTYSDNSLLTKYYYFTLDLSNIDRVVFRDIPDLNSKMEYSYEYRNGGRYIELSGNRKIHCVQTSTQSVYGYSLKFLNAYGNQHIWIDDEDNVVEVLPNMIQLQNDTHRLIGIHSYTSTDKYEAIDIEYFGWRPGNWIFQIKKLLGYY